MTKRWKYGVPSSAGIIPSAMVRRVFELYRRAYSGLPREAWVLFVVNLVNSSGTMVIFFLTLYMTRRLGFSEPQAGRILSVYGLGSMSGAYFGGWLCDRIGSTRVQKICLVLSGLFLVAMSQIDTPWLLIPVLFLFANVAGALYPANAASMSRVCPPDLHVKGFALNRLANNLGITIGPAVGGLLALRDYRLLFWADGVTCLAAAGAFARLWKEPEHGLRAAEARARAARGVEGAPGSAVSSPLRDRPYVLLMLIVLVWAAVFTQLLSTFPLYMRNDYGLHEDQIGRLLAVNTILIVGLEMAVLEWTRRFARTGLINLSFILLGLGFGLMPLSRGFAYGAFTVAVWTFGEMLSIPLLTALIAGRSEAEVRGRYMGIFSFTFSLALILSPAMGTAVYARFGGRTLWFGCTAVGVSLAAAFSFLRPHLEEGRPPASRALRGQGDCCDSCESGNAGHPPDV